MIKKKKWWKAVWIVPITLLVYWMDLIPGEIQQTVSSVLLDKFGGTLTLDNDDTTTIFLLDIQQLYFLVIFNIFFANQIVEHFRYSCIYVFSRINNRKKWFMQCSFELLKIAGVYGCLYVVTIFLMGMINSRMCITKEDILIAMLLCFKVTFLCYITTLVLNIITIRLGSVVAFIITFGLEAVITFISVFIMRMEIFKNHPELVMLNPINGIYEGMFINNVDIGLLVGYNMFLLVFVTVAGMCYIDGLDIALVHVETK